MRPSMITSTTRMKTPSSIAPSRASKDGPRGAGPPKTGTWSRFSPQNRHALSLLFGEPPRLPSQTVDEARKAPAARVLPGVTIEQAQGLFGVRVGGLERRLRPFDQVHLL